MPALCTHFAFKIRGSACHRDYESFCTCGTWYHLCLVLNDPACWRLVAVRNHKVAFQTPASFAWPGCEGMAWFVSFCVVKFWSPPPHLFPLLCVTIAAPELQQPHPKLLLQLHTNLPLRSEQHGTHVGVGRLQRHTLPSRTDRKREQRVLVWEDTRLHIQQWVALSSGMPPLRIRT